MSDNTVNREFLFINILRRRVLAKLKADGVQQGSYPDTWVQEGMEYPFAMWAQAWLTPERRAEIDKEIDELIYSNKA